MLANKSSIVAASMLVLCLVAGGCSADSSKSSSTAAAHSSEFISQSCPVSSHPIDAAMFSTYKGQKVGFCCGGCKSKFDAMTDVEKAALLAKAR